MSTLSISRFRDEVNALYDRYEANFAGRPRANRDLAELDDIISELHSLVEVAREDSTLRHTPSFVSLFETAIDNLKTYQVERQGIAELQKDPLLVEAAEVSSKANRLFAVYGRHFAGQNRSTRDVRLLKDVISELESVKAQMERLVSHGSRPSEEDLEVVRAQLHLYKGEVDHIKQAQLSGSVDERISMLAQLANEQFRIYNAQFAGRSRTSRRPELLQRMIDTLDDVARLMNALQLQPGGDSFTHTTNMSIVADNLNLYREELRLIKENRKEVSTAELVGQLGAAANEIMAEYREHYAGQDRATRNLERLGDLCDGLWDISRQMEALLVDPSLPHNQDNLRIVQEVWSTYEGEYTAVLEVVGKEAN